MASSIDITMSASITVTWEPVPCMYRNGVITGYVIRYRELNNDSVSVETITRDKTSVFEITGLKPSTQYEIEVAAINSVGTGRFTNFNTTTLGNVLFLPYMSVTSLCLLQLLEMVLHLQIVIQMLLIQQ